MRSKLSGHVPKSHATLLPVEVALVQPGCAENLPAHPTAAAPCLRGATRDFSSGFCSFPPAPPQSDGTGRGHRRTQPASMVVSLPAWQQQGHRQQGACSKPCVWQGP